MPLTAQDIKSVMRRYLAGLHRHRDDLNRLNVYPVPDGDTGTNMTLTVEAVMAEAVGAESMAEIARAMAHGSLMGARGNSGVILSQILRGLADVVRGVESMGIAQISAALDGASDAAYEAVMRPVEGTILTVLREAAEAARETATPAGEDIAKFLGSVYRRAEESLERTPELLPVLKEAGVVDAGGAGFLLLLAAFLEEVSGESVSLPVRIFRSGAVTAHAGHVEVSAGGDVSDLRYEVMFFLDADDDTVPTFKQRWSALGDSIVVVGGDGTYNCHIHTDDAGAAIEAGIEAGRPSQIRITDLLEQAAEEGFHRGTAVAAFDPLPEFQGARIGAVAVAAGPGVAEMFRGLGVQGMVLGGQTMNPSLADLLDVIHAVPAPSVVVLPNNKNIVPVAERANEASHKRVMVVPTRTVPQGLAAMVAYRPDEDRPMALAAAMLEAADAVTTGELTQAVRASSTPVGKVERGDWLGLADGDVAVVDPDPTEAMMALLGGIVAQDAEIVTVITGEDADAKVVASAGAWLEEHRPDAEFEVIEGGQPLYPYLLSVE